MKILQPIETFLRQFTKYPTFLSLLVSIGVTTGWILDHFILNKKDKDNNPIFTIYNQPMSTLQQSVVELKPTIAKEWHMGIGSMFTQAPNNVELYTIKLIESYLLVKMPEDNSFRAFPINDLPKTIMINSKFGKHIISVEERDSLGYKLKVLDSFN